MGLRILFILTIIFSIQYSAFSQDQRLASQYYQSGEYEKAAQVYKKLYEASPTSHYYFSQYIECLMSLEEYEEAKTYINKKIRANPNNMELYVTYGNLNERLGNEDEANKQYESAIEKLPPNASTITRLANAFIGLSKFDLAIKAFKKGSEVLSNDEVFAYNLGDIYRRKGDKKQMIQYFLKSSVNNPSRIPRLKSVFQKELVKDEDLNELKKQLYAYTQENPEVMAYQELLQWVFISQKNYKKAFNIARSVDMQSDDNGIRIYELAKIIENAKDYDTAVDAYEYIINEKGSTSPRFFESIRKVLHVKRLQLISNVQYTPAELDSLDNEYVSYIDRFGVNNRTCYMVKEYADFLALHKNDLPKSIEVLTDLVGRNGINKSITANAKLSLGDFLLMSDDIWEATLLYSQVDKAYKEEYLGEIARFKNAKLSYYNGDFEWAQAQFDILKSATSKLISNDAIDLSVFIMDNLNLDTTAVPLQKFADAELLIFQNKFDDAFLKLDSINTLFPGHTLEDDILFSQAQIFEKKKDFVKASEKYEAIMNNFPEEIRADNAIYRLAQISESILDNKEKAQLLYEKIFIDYSNSIFAVDARKRFRILRGDDIQ